MDKLKNLLLLAVSLVVSLGVFEGVLRVAYRSIPIGVVAQAPKFEARTEILKARGVTVGAPVKVLRSSKGGPDIVLPRDTMQKLVDPVDVKYGALSTAYRTDGFCNPKPPKQIPATLVGVGDSFTYCTAVRMKDSWIYQLSALLHAPAVNLGMPGKGLDQYYEALRLEAPPTTRIAVVGIYEGNDLRDAMQFDAARKARAKGAAGRRDRKVILHLVRSSVLSESYLVTFVWGSVRTLMKRLFNPNFSYNVEVGGHRVALNVNNTDVDELRHARLVRDGKVTPKRILQLWGEPIGWIVDLARKRGFVPLFIYIPSAYTAYAKSVRFDNPNNGKAVRELSRVQRKVFAELCRERGLQCLDTVPAFDAASGKQLTHFPSDVHLTPYGHHVVAEAVAGYISHSPKLSGLLAQP